MATLEQISQIADLESGVLFARFEGACLVAAKDIINEDPGTTNHANRVIWANVILTGSESDVSAKVREINRYAIGSNATYQSLGAAVSDSDIQFIVNGIVNTFATGA